MHLSLFRQVKSVEMAARQLPFPLEYDTNFMEKCVPGGSKFPAVSQRNVLELYFYVQSLPVERARVERARVCEFNRLLGNYLQDVPTKDNYNQQFTLYRRVQGLDTKFRASKKTLQKRGNFDPSWGPGCNPVLLQSSAAAITPDSFQSCYMGTLASRMLWC